MTASALALDADDFAAFFTELWSDDAPAGATHPYLWQVRLAKQVCRGEWPAMLDLPTASGKTAGLDIAVFSLAVQACLPVEMRSLGRRIFFVVNRRIIVDQAYRRAQHIAIRLRTAQNGSVLQRVATALRSLNPDIDAPPLDVAVMRGGLARDNRWARSLTQPTIVTSTIDQVGSRMLFRGYGVSPQSAALHAALVANDSLILLDEAHISQPFVETLDAVAHFRSAAWADDPLLPPFAVVALSATPGQQVEPNDVFRMNKREAQERRLAQRHNCPKPVRLHVAAKAKGRKAIEALAADIVEIALQTLAEQSRTIAIIVNRVATAREVYHELQQLTATSANGASEQVRIRLAIGRMRPFDRDRLARELEAAIAGDGPGGTRPLIVVATQCLEVGADYDFDALISECASLDALRQRFGRLNRGGRPIQARGWLVLRADQVSDENDPVYGPALSATWNWLQSVQKNQKVDFGVNAMTGLLTDVDLQPLLAPREHAPVMFPAHLDAWVQSSPVPDWEPEIGPYLHGPQRGEPDVYVCWRRDLPKLTADLRDSTDTWREIVSLCPPTAAERMPVPLGVLKQWLTSQEVVDRQRSDVLDASVDQDAERAERHRVAQDRVGLVWRQPRRGKSFLLTNASNLQPGDTLVLSLTSECWDTLGHISTGSPVDVAEESFKASTGRAIVRLTPDQLTCLGQLPNPAIFAKLTEALFDPENRLQPSMLKELVNAVPRSLDGESRLATELRLIVEADGGFVLKRYAGQSGVVAWTRRQVTKTDAIPALDDGEDESSKAACNVGLEQHCLDVREQVSASLHAVPLAKYRDAFCLAAELHDWGKADPRFQAYLIGGSPWDVAGQPGLWAKHKNAPDSYFDHCRATKSSGRPQGFRHELLSMQLAEECVALPDGLQQRELTLHLIGSHHGYNRPLAPVVPDADPPEISYVLAGSTRSIGGERRRELVPHRLDSGLAERFWSLTRRFGWWGLAYLEAALRLADQTASRRAEEVEAGQESKASRPWIVATPPPTAQYAEKPRYDVLLIGLDGANPLAFLAALGLFRTVALELPEAHVTMRWVEHSGAWRPRIALDQQQIDAADPEPFDLVKILAAALVDDFEQHPVSIVSQLSELDLESGRQFFLQQARACRIGDRLWAPTDWLSALAADSVVGGTSQLQTVRKDYFFGNLQSVIANTQRSHLDRSLFYFWDYADPLDNQSLHFDPSEDRRHALQWFKPSGNPERKKKGGMLGANRLAVEAFPLFQSVAAGDRLITRGFRGTRANDIHWTWPIWSRPVGVDALVTMLGLRELQAESLAQPGDEVAAAIKLRGIDRVYRCARILVEKTPNFTPATAVV